MIDRSYLPFQSARDYQDPGMQKWMGFYLSEHTSSLSEEKSRVDFSTDLTPDEKFHLLSQLYVGQLRGNFVLKEKKQKITIIGVVRELSHQTLSIRTNEGYRLIDVADILEIRLALSGCVTLPDTLYVTSLTFKGQEVYQGLVGDLYRFLSHADFLHQN